MGEKQRPNQHNTEGGENRIVDEHIMDENKQHLESNPHGQPMIPKSGTNPAARELQGKHATGKQTREANHSADEKLDEALQESFPASDPPAQP